MQMTSSHPYLLRAFHEWITDNGMTPYILVDTTLEGTEVPVDYINDNNQITLNIAHHAVHNLQIDNDYMTFDARFNGRSYGIILPIHAILGIFSKESNQGMVFTPETPKTLPHTEGESETTEAEESTAPPPKKRPTLTLVK